MKKTLALSEFEKRLAAKHFFNIVYTKKDLILGYLSIKNDHHIFHLFVDKAYQRRGISKQLWEYVLTQSKQETFTVRSSVYAVPVYKSFGFEIIEPIASKDGLFFQTMKYSSLETP